MKVGSDSVAKVTAVVTLSKTPFGAQRPPHRHRDGDDERHHLTEDDELERDGVVLFEQRRDRDRRSQGVAEVARQQVPEPVEVAGEEGVVEVQDGVLMSDARRGRRSADDRSLVAGQLRGEEVGDERDETAASR